VEVYGGIGDPDSHRHRHGPGPLPCGGNGPPSGRGRDCHDPPSQPGRGGLVGKAGRGQPKLVPVRRLRLWSAQVNQIRTAPIGQQHGSGIEAMAAAMRLAQPLDNSGRDSREGRGAACSGPQRIGAQHAARGGRPEGQPRGASAIGQRSGRSPAGGRWRDQICRRAGPWLPRLLAESSPTFCMLNRNVQQWTNQPCGPAVPHGGGWRAAKGLSKAVRTAL